MVYLPKKGVPHEAVPLTLIIGGGGGAFLMLLRQRLLMSIAFSVIAGLGIFLALKKNRAVVPKGANLSRVILPARGRGSPGDMFARQRDVFDSLVELRHSLF